MRAKGLTVWGIVLLTIGLLAFGAWLILTSLSRPMTTVSLGGAAFQATIAKTPDQLATGLSGATSLSDNQGMLFVFPSDGPQPMWMKGMQINLDMVWLDSSKTVVYEAHNVLAGSYPRIYRSPVPARYVLEIASGEANRAQIDVGMAASFDTP